MGFEVRCYLVPPDRDAEALKKEISQALPRLLLVQVASSDSVRNEAFVELLAWQTLWAGSSGSLLAKTPEMDLLLRLSGTSQISEAIRKTGARKHRQNVLILAGEQGQLDRLHRVLPARAARLKSTQLSREESARVETAALLSTLRA
jgi:tRNA threonylcarbamoyladenosine modification (KEOPS) complex Cgi121 subunit